MMSAVETARTWRRTRRRSSHGPIALPLLGLAAVVALAVSYVGYVLWPRWPGPVVSVDAPQLPIVVGEVTFNIPPGAIRVAVQRKPGVQDRVDLAFLWPSLAPAIGAKSIHRPPAADQVELRPIERVFVTITTSNDALPPIDRLETIYPRYAARGPIPTSTGLLMLRFLDGSPYQGEELIYDASNPEGFFVRCTRDGPGLVPGMCLAERRMRNADMIVRFPRGWLADWRATARGIDRLIVGLKPH